MRICFAWQAVNTKQVVKTGPSGSSANRVSSTLKTLVHLFVSGWGLFAENQDGNVASLQADMFFSQLEIDCFIFVGIQDLFH